MAQKLKPEVELDRLLTYSRCQSGQFLLRFGPAHVRGVNCLISVIFAEGRRVNKSFR